MAVQRRTRRSGTAVSLMQGAEVRHLLVDGRPAADRHPLQPGPGASRHARSGFAGAPVRAGAPHHERGPGERGARDAAGHGGAGAARAADRRPAGPGRRARSSGSSPSPTRSRRSSRSRRGPASVTRPPARPVPRSRQRGGDRRLPRSVQGGGQRRRQPALGGLRAGGSSRSTPARTRCRDLPALRSLLDVEGPVDLAVIAVPAADVLPALKQCAAKRSGGAVVISAGFRETGGEGVRREAELREWLRDQPIRVLGPNCLGWIRPTRRLNVTFAPGMPEPGGIAFITHSGALAVAILDWSRDRRVGFSLFASLGNQADLNESDLLDAVAADPETRVIACYLEGVADGRRFLGALRRAAAVKPVVLLKAGRSAEGRASRVVPYRRARGLRSGVRRGRPAGGRPPGGHGGGALRPRARPGQPAAAARPSPGRGDQRRRARHRGHRRGAGRRPHRRAARRGRPRAPGRGPARHRGARQPGGPGGGRRRAPLRPRAAHPRERQRRRAAGAAHAAGRDRRRRASRARSWARRAAGPSRSRPPSWAGPAWRRACGCSRKPASRAMPSPSRRSRRWPEWRGSGRGAGGGPSPRAPSARRRGGASGGGARASGGPSSACRSWRPCSTATACRRLAAPWRRRRRRRRPPSGSASRSRSRSCRRTSPTRRRWAACTWGSGTPAVSRRRRGHAPTGRARAARRRASRACWSSPWRRTARSSCWGRPRSAVRAPRHGRVRRDLRRGPQGPRRATLSYLGMRGPGDARRAQDGAAARRHAGRAAGGQ